MQFGSDAVVNVNADSVCTTISRFQQSLHQSVWSLSYSVSCMCKGKNPGALQVEKMADGEWKQLGGGQLSNMTHCKSICWCPKLPDDREVLNHCYAAKHIVQSIGGIHKGDLGKGMLKQHPTLDITPSNQYQLRAQVDKFITHYIQSARDNLAVLYDLHDFKSDAEQLEVIDGLLADN